MEEWVVNLIVGIASALVGFAGGFSLKTFISKNKQTIKGDNNIQIMDSENNNEQR